MSSRVSDASDAPLLDRAETRRHVVAAAVGRYYHFVVEFFVAGFLVFGLIAGLLQINAAVRIKLFDWVVISSLVTGLIVFLLAVIHTRVRRMWRGLEQGRDDSGLQLLRANPKLRKALGAYLGEQTLNRLSAVVIFSFLTTVQFMFVYTHVHSYGSQTIDALDRGFPNDQLPTFVHARYLLALTWQVITSAIYLWKVLGGYYKHKSLRHFKIRDDG